MESLRRIAKWVLPGFLLLFAGCVSSVHPLYLEADTIFDEALLGVWGAEDSTETWELRKHDEKAYTVVHTDEKGRRGEFRAHLLILGEQRFLDLDPVESEIPQSGFYRDRLLPTHTFVAIAQAGPAMRVSYLDQDWLKRFLAEQPAALRHETVQGEILITASPRDLQRFLLDHQKTEGAFSEPCELKRTRK